MITENEKFIVEQLIRIRRDLKILKSKWDRMVEAVMATPLFKNLESQPNKTYQLCIKIAGKDIPI